MCSHIVTGGTIHKYAVRKIQHRHHVYKGLTIPIGSPDSSICQHRFSSPVHPHRTAFFCCSDDDHMTSRRLSFASLRIDHPSFQRVRSRSDRCRPGKTFSTLRSDRKNASCKGIQRLGNVRLRITAEILRSDEPCAMATTFTPFLPSALNIRPLVPGLCFIPSPTTATIDKSLSTGTSSISSFLISYWNSRSIADLALVHSFVRSQNRSSVPMKPGLSGSRLFFHAPA